jgi:probable rRNA maturation factor
MRFDIIWSKTLLKHMNSMSNDIVLEVSSEEDFPLLPTKEELLVWVERILLSRLRGPVELSIRFVTDPSMRYLNETYRQKKGLTNVLSFPCETPEFLDLPVKILGELIFCPHVVYTEAREQNKAVQAHWAHLLVHGVLHLLGYDHLADQEANVMEALEIELLAQLGFENPYVLK